jgi:hypothetical protein
MLYCTSFYNKKPIIECESDNAKESAFVSIKTKEEHIQILLTEEQIEALIDACENFLIDRHIND